MTTISHLNISEFRNIESLSIDSNPRVNLIHGANGSGKTSMLEAIHLLATGKSFRSTKTSPIIRQGSGELTVYAELSDGAGIGLQKYRNQKPVLKLHGKKQQSWVEVARILPVQILDSATFRLLEGSPKERRRFLDWGVFHVEPGFIDHWRNSRKCIANRNYLLKGLKPDLGQIRAWNVELAKEAEQVDLARKTYFSRFLPIFEEVIYEISEIRGISLHYKRGWDADADLLALLERAKGQDLKYGTTQIGPHRADIIVKKDDNFAADVLSRGQQKLLVSALKLAQGVIQAEQDNRQCIFLVDDLPAELDEINRARICRFLQEMGGQVFMTCVDDGALQNSLEWDSLVTKFHVEHGKIVA